MRIAVATEGTKVCGHFGKCESFTIIDIEDSQIKNKTLLDTTERQHGLLPPFLAEHNVNVVIAGGMGEGARQNLISNNIQIVAGVSGNIDEAVSAYLNGSLKSIDTGCSGHDHGHGAGGCSCGHH